MGTLLSLQNKAQDAIESVINTIEDGYLSAAQKSIDLIDQNKRLAIQTSTRLRDLNTIAGKTVATLISKIEKEPTTEEKVKDAVDKAADATKTVVEKAAEKASKVADKIEKVAEEALA